jgi:hypothetical protein
MSACPSSQATSSSRNVNVWFVLLDRHEVISIMTCASLEGHIPCQEPSARPFVAWMSPVPYYTNFVPKIPKCVPKKGPSNHPNAREGFAERGYHVVVLERCGRKPTARSYLAADHHARRGGRCCLRVHTEQTHRRAIVVRLSGIVGCCVRDGGDPAFL